MGMGVVEYFEGLEIVGHYLEVATWKLAQPDWATGRATRREQNGSRESSLRFLADVVVELVRFGVF
jgi:hypothetical protein